MQIYEKVITAIQSAERTAEIDGADITKTALAAKATRILHSKLKRARRRYRKRQGERGEDKKRKQQERRPSGMGLYAEWAQLAAVWNEDTRCVPRGFAICSDPDLVLHGATKQQKPKRRKRGAALLAARAAN